MQLPVLKGRNITGAFYKNVVLKRFKVYLKRCHPKTGLEYLCFLHDNAPAHKAKILTEFLESKKVNVLPYPPFSPELAPCDYFLFPKLKLYQSERDVSLEMCLGLLYISYTLACLFRTMNGAFKIGLTA